MSFIPYIIYLVHSIKPQAYSAKGKITVLQTNKQDR